MDVCNDDSDGDGVTDFYEWRSAIDLNDDEYRDPSKPLPLPYPVKRPYPNALFADADVDYDGDALTLKEEHDLWAKQGGRAANESDKARPLLYSDGLQYSDYRVVGSRRVPNLAAAGYAKQQQFLAWAASADGGYSTVTPPARSSWTVTSAPVDIRDVNRNGGAPDGPDCAGQPREAVYFDYDCDGFLSDDERDEDADGLTNYDESTGRARPEYWAACYAQEAVYDLPYSGTDLADEDSDGDGIRDGADDQDFDDLPNMMELSRMGASRGQVWDADGVGPNPPVAYPAGFDETDGTTCKPAEGLDPKAKRHADNYGKVNPFDPCDPNPNSRTCERHVALGSEPDPDWWSLQ